MQRRRFVHGLAAGGLTALGPLAPLCGVGAMLGAADPARAQESWPARPLRIVVGFAPGSGNDLIARQLAPKLSEALGQSVIVENKAGAGGMLGTDSVAKAAPDGHTLGLGTSSQLVMNPALAPKLPFDVDKDLAMIGLISRTHMVLAAKQDGPADLQALIARARANPGKVSYGSAGNGSISHIVAEAFARAAGITLLHVPYKGNGPAMNDLAGGQVDLVFDGFQTAGPLMRSGKIRILAVSGTRRHPQYTDVPTFADAQLADYEAYTWNGLFAPRGVPRAVLERLNRELNKAMLEADIKSRLEASGAENISGGTPEQADAFAQGQRSRWVPAVKAMGITS
jgi:tripartite-type tricarboxylate transporter receptor subunit TctC